MASRNSTVSSTSKMSSTSMPQHPSMQPPTPPANYPSNSLRRPTSNLSNSNYPLPPQQQHCPSIYDGQSPVVASGGVPFQLGNPPYTPSLARNSSINQQHLQMQQQQQQQLQQQQLLKQQMQQQQQQQQMFMSDNPPSHLPPDLYMTNSQSPSSIIFIHFLFQTHSFHYITHPLTPLQANFTGNHTIAL